jgi:hypothetical protein
VDENGTPASKVYVKFGPRETQEMPLDWAEKILTNWREKNPAQFGKMLAEVVTGAK